MLLKYKLINLLSDGKFHSGEQLGHQLQITRSAIWKIIPSLKKLGIEVHSVKGKGYYIPNGLELLDVAKIKNLLAPSILKRVDIDLAQEITSTNQFLLDHRETKKSGSILFSEYQMNGRGRRHRKWFSPYGCNIYFSLLWSFDKDPSELSGLSLATGVAVANTLERYGIHNVKLKWPNDILWNHKKISGILIEMMGETNSSTNVVIGIGLNVQMPMQTEIDQDWIDVSTITGQKPQRNLLATYLIEEVIEMLSTFEQKGFSGFVKYWKALDAFYDQPVILSTPMNEFAGIAKGINQNGEFILMSPENKEMRFLHGEVSLRRAL